MKYFHYTITDGDITQFTGEVSAVPGDFIESEITLLGESVYYKTVNGKMTEVIGEAIHEDVARQRVEEFLSAFLMTPFESL
jgi:hypothetical protein